MPVLRVQQVWVLPPGVVPGAHWTGVCVCVCACVCVLVSGSVCMNFISGMPHCPWQSEEREPLSWLVGGMLLICGWPSCS